MKHTPTLLILAFLLCMATFSLAQDQEVLVKEKQDRIAKADSLIATFKFESALEILSEEDSLDLNVLLRIGLCNTRLGSSTLAIKPYEQVLQIDSTNATALNQLGLLYSRAGNAAAAMESFLKLINLDPSNSYYYKQAGLMAERSENIIDAMRLYAKALQLNPKDIETSLALGTIQFEMKDYKRADSTIQRALAIDPQFNPMLLLHAKSSFAQQHYAEVVTTINHLLTKSDTIAVYARLLGISYSNLKEYTKLSTCMDFLLKNMYDYEWIFYYKGIAAYNLGDVEASINWYQIAVQKSISGNIRTYYSQLAKSYEETGNHQEAIKAYRAAYDYSKDGIFLYHLARNYDTYYKDKSTAILYYRKYLESDDTIRVTREYARKRMQDEGWF